MKDILAKLLLLLALLLFPAPVAVAQEEYMRVRFFCKDAETVKQLLETPYAEFAKAMTKQSALGKCALPMGGVFIARPGEPALTVTDPENGTVYYVVKITVAPETLAIDGYTSTTKEAYERNVGHGI